MYICEHCETPFDEPRTITDAFWDDGRRVVTQESRCPICDWPVFSPANLCPIRGCGRYKIESDRLCRLCRKDLADRFIAFADSLTAEEEEQLDDWLDGTSITKRSDFR